MTVLLRLICDVSTIKTTCRHDVTDSRQNPSADIYVITTDAAQYAVLSNGCSITAYCVSITNMPQIRRLEICLVFACIVMVCIVMAYLVMALYYVTDPAARVRKGFDGALYRLHQADQHVSGDSPEGMLALPSSFFHQPPPFFFILRRFICVCVCGRGGVRCVGCQRVSYDAIACHRGTIRVLCPRVACGKE